MSLTYQGVPASPGIVIGKAWIYRPAPVAVQRDAACSPEIEWEHFTAAKETARQQLERLADRCSQQVGAEEAAIFGAHLMFLDDPDLGETIRASILEGGQSASAAAEAAFNTYAETMEALQDEYLGARAQDIRDVSRRVQYCLMGIDPAAFEMPDQPVVILAEDLAPSDTVQFDKHLILGFCTVKGGPTSHVAIMARSLGAPAVVCTPFNLESLPAGIQVALDGTAGKVILDPAPEEIQVLQKDQDREEAAWQQALSQAHFPAVTRDGRQVEVVANIGSAEDAHTAVLYGAEGVGLLRTEFLYLDRDTLPNEAEQIHAYAQIFAVMGSRPVVVRTLDIGGDKTVSYLGVQAEPNPFLGWRAIRMINERPDVLRDQCRSLLQAGVNACLRIMLPMVSSLNEVRQAKAVYCQARDDLLAGGLPCAQDVQFGIMVEVPSAALIAEHLAEEVDFFSIGTNDLTQYTLAVDRTNERVAPLASPFHPAVLRLIALTIESAHKKGRWVGLCGELAGDPKAAGLLLGLGLDEFSMAAKSIPVVKAQLRTLDSAACRQVASQALSQATTQDVIDLLDDAFAHD
jgi:phosphoenolpyruvate-protein phosphotransferase